LDKATTIILFLSQKIAEKNKNVVASAEFVHLLQGKHGFKKLLPALRVVHKRAHYKVLAHELTV
jgi:hypothetical protein